MNIHFEPMQVLHLALVASLVGLIFWKKVPNKMKIVIAVIAIVLTLFNPFRFVQPNYSSIEKMNFDSREDTLPPKVTVEKENFSKWNEEELKKLQKESKEKELNEVHN